MLRIRSTSCPLACGDGCPCISQFATGIGTRTGSPCNQQRENFPSPPRSLTPSQDPIRIPIRNPGHSPTLFHLRAPSRTRTWVLRPPINPSPCPCEIAPNSGVLRQKKSEKNGGRNHRPPVANSTSRNAIALAQSPWHSEPRSQMLSLAGSASAVCLGECP